MKKAIVTGGVGFLGRHICRKLIAGEVEVVSFDINEPVNIIEGLTYIQGDINELDALTEASNGCDTMFHTAALANIDEAKSKPIETFKINVFGTVNTLETCRRLNIIKYVFASSVYVGGNLGSFYNISKKSGEDLCRVYSEEFGINYTIVRYGSLYGHDTNDWNMIFDICTQLLDSGKYDYYGDGNETREFIHISDASSLTVNIANSDEYINKCVLITGQQKMKMKEFFNMIEEILGLEVKINYKSNDHKHYKMTPYTFNKDIPKRISMSSYIDISEGILGCLEAITNENKKQ